MAEAFAAEQLIAGRYRLARRLGAGSFGAVWLAFDEGAAGNQVALKLLHPHLRRTPGVARRFEQEIQVLLSLGHPCIARAEAGGTHGSDSYLVMEYVLGDPLSELLPRQRFSPKEVQEIFADLCGALTYAHSRGVIHRDLKPANVHLHRTQDFWAVKVLDFGIAHLADSDHSDRTTVGRILGSPAYLAPEQMDSSGVGPTTDVFALGTLLFELLTSHRAWLRDEQDRPVPSARLDAALLPANQRVPLLARIRHGERPRPSVVAPELPAALDLLMERALAPVPEDRPPSVSALFREFQASLAAPALTSPDVPAPSAGGVLDSVTLVMPSELGDGEELATPAVRTLTDPAVPAPSHSGPTLTDPAINQVQARERPSTRPRPRPSLATRPHRARRGLSQELSRLAPVFVGIIGLGLGLAHGLRSPRGQKTALEPHGVSREVGAPAVRPVSAPLPPEAERVPAEVPLAAASTASPAPAPPPARPRPPPADPGSTGAGRVVPPRSADPSPRAEAEQPRPPAGQPASLAQLRAWISEGRRAGGGEHELFRLADQLRALSAAWPEAQRVRAHACLLQVEVVPLEEAWRLLESCVPPGA